MATISPYLTVDDGPAALEFYAQAFGAEVVERYDDGDQVAHATLRVGDAVFFVSSEFPGLGAVAPATVGASTVAVVLTVPDADAVYAAAVLAGARADRPVATDGGGTRSGWLVDPSGHRWNVRGAP
ncbi:VOC family protein [Luteimicrobium sp. DT211]|uniref:VOC family protein n=1 Tax=Luteimicrobium sp. DT211 TaxID=3393412 RepID=UPI003CE77462